MIVHRKWYRDAACFLVWKAQKYDGMYAATAHALVGWYGSQCNTEVYIHLSLTRNKWPHSLAVVSQALEELFMLNNCTYCSGQPVQLSLMIISYSNIDKYKLCNWWRWLTEHRMNVQAMWGICVTVLPQIHFSLKLYLPPNSIHSILPYSEIMITLE